MKRPKGEARARNGNKRMRQVRARDEDPITEMLKLCLQKVCEMQADLERSEEEVRDPEAAGYTACAIETLRFLSAQGLPPDHPVVKGLAERLLRKEGD